MFDLNEPIYVHVCNGRNEAKFWIEPLALAWNQGYRKHELNEVERLVEEKRSLIVATWQKELNKR